MIFHALGLNMQRPPGDLQRLIDEDEREAEKVVRGYQSIARYAQRFSDVGRFHVSFSGVLLEQLCEPRIVDRYQRFVDIPAMLESFRSCDNVEFIGMGYYHPLFPLISAQDWNEQIARGREIIEDLFGRAPRGFWPSEGSFCTRMIPALAQAGYEYVVVNDTDVAVGDAGDRYQPYVGRCDGESVCVIVRDCELSAAQQCGMDASSFAQLVQRKTATAGRANCPRLLTTWVNVEEGDWLRELGEESSFYSRYFDACMRGPVRDESSVQSTLLADFISQYPPNVEVHAAQSVDRAASAGTGGGAANAVQSESRREASAHVKHLSDRYWRLRRAQPRLPQATKAALCRVRELILESESSCYFSSQEQWTARLHERTAAAAAILADAEAALPAAN